VNLVRVTVHTGHKSVSDAVFACISLILQGQPFVPTKK